MKTSQMQSSEEPVLVRSRHPLKLRQLLVTQRTQLTPNMVRIEFESPDLADFASLSPDDHVKVFIPLADGESAKRDYTPRYFSAAEQRLTLDFAVHEGGPAAQWAQQAQAGQTLQVGGPKGSQVVEGDIRQWLLIGDETALPAIGRRLEELPAGVHVQVLVTVPSADDCQTFETAADTQIHWHCRSKTELITAEPLLQELDKRANLQQTFCWLAGESGMVKAVRQYLLESRQLQKPWLKAAGYWRYGSEEAGERFD